jgi:hypothetical protein
VTQTVENLGSAPKEFRPGAIALRDAWFPLVHVNQVKRRPVARSLHGEPVIFYRRRRTTGHTGVATPGLGVPRRRR